MSTHRVIAATLKPGDRVHDPATGRTAVVMPAAPIRSKHDPGKVGWLLRCDDDRVVRMTVADTDAVDVVR